MARTPGIFSAVAVSSLTTLPLAIVASTGTAYSIPGKRKSEVYCANPLTLRGPSTRGVSRPTGETIGVSSVVGMFAPSVESAHRRHLQGVREAPLRQFDLKLVLALRFGVAHSRFRGLAKVGCVGRTTDESGLGLPRSPGFGPHAAQCDARPSHISARDRDHDGRRRQSKFVRRPVAQLQIHLLASLPGRRERDVRDEVAGFEHCFAVWCAAGQKIKVADGDRA